MVGSVFDDFREKDPNTFDKFYRKFSDYVIWYFYLRTGDMNDAEDLSQDLWLRVYRKSHTFGGDTYAEFFQWMRRTAARLLLDRGRPRPGPLPEDLQVVRDLSPDECVSARETAEQIVRTLSGLSQADQDLVILVFQQGFSRREVASLLRVRIHRALKRCGHLLRATHLNIRGDMLPAQVGKVLSLAFECLAGRE